MHVIKIQFTVLVSSMLLSVLYPKILVYPCSASEFTVSHYTTHCTVSQKKLKLLLFYFCSCVYTNTTWSTCTISPTVSGTTTRTLARIFVVKQLWALHLGFSGLKRPESRISLVSTVFLHSCPLPRCYHFQRAPSKCSIIVELAASTYHNNDRKSKNHYHQKNYGTDEHNIVFQRIQTLSRASIR